MSLQIETVLVPSISGIRRGEEAIFRETISGCGLHTQDLTSEKLRDFLAARKGDHIIGIIGIEILGKNAMIRSLCVTEKHRGQGVAGNLLSSIERYALSRQAKMLYLLTVTSEIFFAERGYEKMDFKDVPEDIRSTDAFSRMCTSDAICMQKRLSIHV